MRKRRKDFLSDFVVNQYPIEKYKTLVFITLDIVENFLIELEEGFDYDSTTLVSYGKKYGNSQKSNSSKIESILINGYKSKEAMTKFLNNFFYALNFLSEEELNIFGASYIDRLTDLEIIDKYHTYSKYINLARKSATVKFVLKSGLDKFVDLVE